MKGTIEDDIQSAIVNLKLFLEDDCRDRSNYLLDFAEKQIQDARQRLNALPE
jgi:hypothetical protein